jgi:hypothetical protein
LAPSTDLKHISSVSVSVTEHLEAVRPDGRTESLISAGGDDLFDDLAFILSFSMNATFSRDYDQVRRLVPDRLDARRRLAPANMFRDTFDPALVVKDSELDYVRAFTARLLSLKRPCYAAAMKAIRRVIRACRRAIDDPTLAYTDLVAALESLSKDEPVSAPSWSQLDGSKRNLIDVALQEATPELATRVRKAMIQAEHLGLRNRFTQFVLNHVSPVHFRGEAIAALRPIRRPDLERAVRLAYDIRSRNVHSLWDMPPEAWVFNDRADTVSQGDLGTMLSLEGLARLARHVIKAYVQSAPIGVDPSFNWRENLPGVVRARLAPQYWIHASAGFDHKSAANYFEGFVENLVEAVAGRTDGPTDMRKVLEKVEKLTPGTADGDAKTIMVAIYELWHRFLNKAQHRPSAATFLTRHGHVLHEPSITSFVVNLLLGHLPGWSTAQWESLATQRSDDRQRRDAQPVPAPFDAALQAFVAERVLADRRPDEAIKYAARAIEELPGNEQLIAWEVDLTSAADRTRAASAEGHGNGDQDTGVTCLDLHKLVLGVAPRPDDPKTEDAAEPDTVPEST